MSEATQLPESILKVGHDFFQPQPESAKAAKVYYLRMILHDWPEKQCKKILQNIVDVMSDDSLVLVHEVVVKEGPVGLMEANMDWHMMNLGGSERTEKQWRELGASVGLKLNDIHMEADIGTGARGLIEFAKA